MVWRGGEEEKDFLLEILGSWEIEVDSPLQIERAHHISTQDSLRIRSIIVKFGNYQQNMKVMNCAQERGQKDFLDSSAIVQKKRKLFTPVKKKLQVAGINVKFTFLLCCLSSTRALKGVLNLLTRPSFFSRNWKKILKNP